MQLKPIIPYIILITTCLVVLYTGACAVSPTVPGAVTVPHAVTAPTGVQNQAVTLTTPPSSTPHITTSTLPASGQKVATDVLTTVITAPDVQTMVSEGLKVGLAAAPPSVNGGIVLAILALMAVQHVASVIKDAKAHQTIQTAITAAADATQKASL